MSESYILEVAPSELRELLMKSKAQLSGSMTELHEAIKSVKEAQKLQVKSIQESIESVNSKNVDNIRSLHQSLVSEILSANSSIDDSVQKSVEEIKNAKEEFRGLQAGLQVERNTHTKVMKALIEGLTRTTNDLELANAHISTSVNTLERLKLSRFLNRWMIVVSFISVFVFASLLTLGLVKLTNAEDTRNSSAHFVRNTS